LAHVIVWSKEDSPSVIAWSKEDSVCVIASPAGAKQTHKKG